MSDAKVQFQGDHEENPEPGKEQTFSFQCPKYNRRCGDLLIAGRNPGLKRDGQNKNGGVAMWEWNGNRESPTFHPSVDCKGCWHGFIENGRCVNTHRVDEPEREIKS